MIGLKLVLTLYLAIAAVTVNAQPPVWQKLVDAVGGSRVEIEYIYRTASTSGEGVDGSLSMQGKAFDIEYGDLSTVSDGSSVWTLDKGAKEAVAEDAGSNSLFTVNPLLYLYEWQDYFTFKSSRDYVSEGVKSCDLTFISKDAPMVSSSARNPVTVVVSIAIKKDSTPKVVSLRFSGSIDAEIAVTAMDYLPRSSDMSRYSVRGLDSSWVVTDLRQ